MEAWIHKKSLVIENLIAVTSSLIRSVDAEDWTQFDISLRRRAQLFSELQQLDLQFGSVPSGEEGKWLKQLKLLDDMGTSLQGHMMQKKLESSREINATRDERVQWINDNLLTGRGHHIEVKA
jgi:hypothetical protein